VIAENYLVSQALREVNLFEKIGFGRDIVTHIVQEYTGEDVPPKSTILKQPLVREGGYLLVPNRPGIGVELDMDVVRAYPPVAKVIATPLHEDGSVADW